jgi:FAD-dependent urate hydroxylase
MTTRRALIMGGGIGGPVAAMALERAGIQATVYEAADAPADHVGLFLNTSSTPSDRRRDQELGPVPSAPSWKGGGRLRPRRGAGPRSADRGGYLG